MTSHAYRELAKFVRPALTKLYVLYFRIAEASDLTGPQLTILSHLAETGPSRISEIAKTEGIRMPTASNALRQLEERGMIERIREESDRRGVKVKITDFGTEEMERVGNERIEYLADMFSVLSEEKLEKAYQLAEIINELAESYHPEDVIKHLKDTGRA